MTHEISCSPERGRFFRINLWCLQFTGSHWIAASFVTQIHAATLTCPLHNPTLTSDSHYLFGRPARSIALAPSIRLEWPDILRVLTKITLAMEEVVFAVARGITGPFIQPIAQWLEMRVVRRRQVNRRAPALLVNNNIHICEDIDKWLRNSNSILHEEKWLKELVCTKEVSLHAIAPALTHHHFCTAESANVLEDTKVTVLGPTSAKKRLALILWGIKTGVLKIDGNEDDSRSKPAIIVDMTEIHECNELDLFAVESESILKREVWVASALKTREVKLGEVAPVLWTYNYCNREVVKSLRDTIVLVVGVNDAVHRLALILWGARKGILQGTQRLKQTRPADGPIDLRLQALPVGLPDPLNAWRPRMDAFSPEPPDAGIPISISKVTMPLTIDFCPRPTPMLFVSERFVRDLTTLMYDPRGAFEVDVQCSLSRSLGDIVKAPDSLLSRFIDDIVEARNDELPKIYLDPEAALLNHVEAMVHDLICITADFHYRRPVRPSGWSFVRELNCPFVYESQWCSDFGSDGQSVVDWGWMARTGELSKLSVNTNEVRKLPREVRWVIKGWKLLGCPVEYAHHDFGLLWISRQSIVEVILGNVELEDARRNAEKLASSDSSRRTDGAGRRLYVWGWHHGPFVEESAQGWLIHIHDLEDFRSLDLIDVLVLRALPLKLC